MPYDRGVMRPCDNEPMRLRRRGGKVTVVTQQMGDVLRQLGPQAREVVSRLPQTVKGEDHGKR